MNPFLIIILAALIAEFALHLTANLLNLRSLRPEPPSDLEGIYILDDYRNSQEYTRTNTRFGLLVSAFRLLLLLSFWFAGGFDYLDQAVRTWELGPIAGGLLYIGILAAAYMLVSIPFNVYATFVIEEHFGFNRTTPRTFLLDCLKGLSLTTLLGAPLLVTVLSIFEYLGPYAWLYCWAVVIAFFLAIQFIAPTWIMPLFNKFTPMEAGELRDGIIGYARSVDFPVKNIFVMDGSRRSSKSNAFFTGIGRNKRIALFDALVERHTVPEVVAVLAHEIGHHKRRHILQGTVFAVMNAGVIFFLLSVFLSSSNLYQAFYVEQPSIYTGLLFFGMLYTPIDLVLSMALNTVSRRNEYQADRYAVETIEKPMGLVDALKRLHATSLSNLTPHPLFVFLNYSHPPLLQRVRAIQQYEA